MCEFFSAVACRDGRLLFCEDNSHEVTITRACLKDDDLHIRGFVRVERKRLPDGSWDDVRVDQTSTPGWYEADRTRWDDRVAALSERVAPLLDQYEAGRRPLWNQYEARCKPLWDQYDAGCRLLLDQYEAAISSIEGYVSA